MQEFKLFIDGAWTDAQDGATYESINPATEKPWARFAAAGSADVDRAVTAAQRAFREGPWRRMSNAERADVLDKIANEMVERQDEIVLAEVQDGGGTMRKGHTADVTAAMQTFQYYAELIRQAPTETATDSFVPVPSKNIIRKEPLGVVAAIVPFNFPFAAASWKVAPALAAGCSIVLKPSPYTPATALLLAEICHSCGVPDGVFSTLVGPANELGAELVAHEGVDKIAFTGSTRVGKAVMRSAADRVVPVTLELGGKSANIILKDANLESAVRGALFATFFHQGQICVSGTRLLVPRDMHDDFVARMVDDAKNIRIGDPMDMMSTMGPLISEQQRANVERYVAKAIEEGATCALGGKRPDGLETGYYYEPTILTGVTNDMTIACEEVFGPVVAVIPYDTEDEAVQIANDSMYGLAGAVWSTDLERATAIAGRLETGTVWINDYHLLAPQFTFGGYKKSGFGRELGPEGLAAYQVTKHIHVGQPDGNMEKYYFSMLVDDMEM